MLAELPDTLQTFFCPQIEQLRMRETRAELGGCAVLPEELGDGYLWVAALGPYCLLSVHDFTLKEEIRLKEYPHSSYALCLMTANMAELAPVPPFQAEQDDNLVAFEQSDGETCFKMPMRSRCHSTTLCFLPEYFDHAASITGVDPEAIKDRFRKAAPGSLPLQLRCRLRSLSPNPRGGDDVAVRYASLAFDSLSMMMRPPHNTQARQQERELVSCAIDAMSEHMADKVTLDDLAASLYVSKSTLCKAFRDVEGKGASEVMAHLRMQRASELLVESSLPIGDIAKAVGFAHQSSFCKAYKRHCGISPTCARTHHC